MNKGAQSNTPVSPGQHAGDGGGQAFAAPPLETGRGVGGAVHEELDAATVLRGGVRGLELRLDPDQDVRVGEAEVTADAGVTHHPGLQHQRPHVSPPLPVRPEVVLHAVADKSLLSLGEEDRGHSEN